MKRYFLTPAAKTDLVEIYEYIHHDKPMAAARVMARIRDAIRRLAETPGMGHRREDLTDDDSLRFWPIYSFLIVYRLSKGPIQVLRVVHGARDVSRILDRVT